MIKRVDLGLGQSREIFGNPVPLGLLGLAIASAALTPVAFGLALTPEGLTTTAVWALLFGAGCQLLSGLMSFANKNVFGGTIFTAFSFLWMVNAWGLYSVAQGLIPHHAVGLATEIVLLTIFLVLTYGFGFFSRILFLFLADIDLLFMARIIKSVTATTTMDIPIGVLNVAMGAIALWLAFGALINPVAGKTLFPMGTPLFHPPAKRAFDWTLRYNLFDILYAHWRDHAFDEMALGELQRRMAERTEAASIVPDLYYLAEFGTLVLTQRDGRIVSCRLNAQGLDLYEQLILRKYEW